MLDQQDEPQKMAYEFFIRTAFEQKLIKSLLKSKQVFITKPS